ncbi:hypothetical protein [Kamptonema formosum]|uniref:hypothetical protein n=1 Tax=Kamptonema formosum TaxID=331992 RepID=UPI0012DDA58F|nr:hypothetical protein [Oscillatoria sp. PCC 10802]
MNSPLAIGLAKGFPTLDMEAIPRSHRHHACPHLRKCLLSPPAYVMLRDSLSIPELSIARAIDSSVMDKASHLLVGIVTGETPVLRPCSKRSRIFSHAKSRDLHSNKSARATNAKH